MTPLPAARFAFALLLLAVAGPAAAQNTKPDAKTDTYPPHPDATRRDGVAEGRLDGPHEFRSDVFPGTVRNYWVWVPAGYEQRQAPACQLIVQDGLGKAKSWSIPETLDNLIDDGSMPYTLGIFVDHGKVPPPDDAPEGTQPRFNRSFEYDSMGPRYAEFLLDELLPAIGQTYDLSDDPNDRMLAGSSSGGIASFTAAWERPDAFRRVFCAVGTFVGLRGGDEYPTLIRKTEPKPLRVFLQDGSNDLDIYAGGWWAANLSMLSALEFAGYDVRHEWGEGGHNGKHAAAIFPDALRWLWRDYPEPVAARPMPNRRMDLLVEAEGWEQISEGHEFTEGPAIGPDGSLYFTDVRGGKVFRVTDFDADSPTVTPVFEGEGVAGMMLSEPVDDGQGGERQYFYATMPFKKQVVRFPIEADGSFGPPQTLAAASCNDLTRVPGGVYFTDPRRKTVWWLADGKKPRPVSKDVPGCNGLTTSADRSFLWVADSRERHLWHFRVEPDHTLSAGQKYGYIHSRTDGTTGSDGMAIDTEGRVYVGTNIGVQITDQLGRVHWILPAPNNAKVASVTLAGPDRSHLIACAMDRVYRRRVNATGVRPWQERVAASRPGL